MLLYCMHVGDGMIDIILDRCRAARDRRSPFWELRSRMEHTAVYTYVILDVDLNNKRKRTSRCSGEAVCGVMVVPVLLETRPAVFLRMHGHR